MLDAAAATAATPCRTGLIRGDQGVIQRHCAIIVKTAAHPIAYVIPHNAIIQCEGGIISNSTTLVIMVTILNYEAVHHYSSTSQRYSTAYSLPINRRSSTLCSKTCIPS